jgi:hypothetical protein
MRGVDFVVGNDSACEKTACPAKDLADAEVLSLGDSPRLHVLAPNTVTVRRLLLQHSNRQSRSGKHQRNGCPANSPSDYHDLRKSSI